MSDRSILQRLAGLIADLVRDAADFGIPEVREAVLADLGGTPGSKGGVDFDADKLDAVANFSKAVHPDAVAEAEAIGNIAILLGAIFDQIEAWDADWVTRGETLAHGVLDLLASNYLRRESPRAFIFLQSIVEAFELTDTNGPGEKTYDRFGRAIATIFKFIWNPGRTLDDIDKTRIGAHGGTDLDDPLPIIDGALRGALATLAVLDQIAKDHAHRDNVLGDIIVGWDGPGLDVDSKIRPSAADLVSSRMMSAEIRHRAGDAVEEKLRFSWLYMPKRDGAPARPHQLFLGLGGELSFDHEFNPQRAPDAPEWRFKADVRSDDGASLLISGDTPHVQSDITGSTAQLSAAWTIVPGGSGVSYPIHVWPSRLGVRVDLGELAFAATLSGTAARVLLRAENAALVIDRASRDAFMRMTLHGKPFRYQFGVAIGYDTQLGFIHEIHKSSSTPAAGGEPPFDSFGPAGPPDLSLTLPLGAQLGPITIHEIVLRLAYAKADEPATGSAVAAGVLVTFSTTLGPLYVRVDRLGLGATADTMTPPAERNLRVVQAGFDAAAPQGIAIQLDTGPISGGGAIQHDPATGDYVGALVLRLGERVSLSCIGLASTKDRDGNDESSLILIGTIEHLDLQAGFVTFDGFGVIYAADRRVDQDAIRTALPTGQLRQVLFPADPVKHLPELASALRTFFPVQPGVHCYGILVKLFFGAGQPLIRADLALLLERDSVADKSRLVLLGRISSVLPREEHAMLRLNLDAIGVFDLDSGEMAVDAVLYKSDLCGRFVLTGGAAFRRKPGEGFVLAVGGFNPRFQPPSGFPVVPRVTIALTTGDNPKLIAEAYFALTSNTVQFGARASLYASAYGFSIEGYVEFHVLIQLWPPHFIADFGAGVQLKRGSRNLFKVDVRGTLEGPLPLRVAGKATFGILWWDYSVGFDKTLIEGSQNVVTEALDVLTELITRLSAPSSWRAEPLPIAARMVSVRSNGSGADPLLLHPLGRLEVRQGLVPLNLNRDIDRVGAFVPAGDALRFAITSASVGGSAHGTQPVFDDFADGQFFEMSDDERLAAPSFTRREAGKSFGLDDYRTDASLAESSPFKYTEIVIDADGNAVQEPEPQKPSPDFFATGFRICAAARAHSRTGRTPRYAEPVLANAPRLEPLRRRA